VRCSKKPHPNTGEARLAPRFDRPTRSGEFSRVPDMTLQAASLAALPNIRHAFFTRHGGASGGLYASLNGGIGSRDEPENVRENRARMARALDAEHLVTAYQVHSPRVVVADQAWTRENAPRADALVTRARSLAVGITTADCGPVLLADAEAQVIGAAHVGWKGALAGILEATIAAMEKLGAARVRIHAALGPMIRQASYEVGPEFVARFLDADPRNARFFAGAQVDGHARFDLAGHILSRLERAQVGRVEDLGRCTYAEAENFFSYRRATHRAEPDYGRHISAIALVE
jgi:YfiH family protein